MATSEKITPYMLRKTTNPCLLDIVSKITLNFTESEKNLGYVCNIVP